MEKQNRTVWWEKYGKDAGYPPVTEQAVLNVLEKYKKNPTEQYPEDIFVEYKQIVTDLHKEMRVEEGIAYINLDAEDVPIIYGFWKLKVNIIVVRDNAFENTCKELNINAIKWPSFS